MTHFVFRLLSIALLLLAAPAIAAAPQRALTAREAYLVNVMVFQSNNAQAALTRRADAALNAKNGEIVDLLRKLRNQQTAARGAQRNNRTLLADNARLEDEVTRQLTEFNTALAARDTEFAAEREKLQADALDLMATQEGREGLEAFNSDAPGSVERANAVWDRLIDMRTARQFRQIAQINATKLGQGQVTTPSLIDRWEKIPVADRLHWDWVNLSRLYRNANRLPDAAQAAQNARTTATSDRDRSGALDENGDILVKQGDLPGALQRYEEGLTIRRAQVKADPRNAVAQRDLSISLFNLARIPGSGHSWGEVKLQWDAMRQRGMIAPEDEQFTAEINDLADEEAARAK